MFTRGLTRGLTIDRKRIMIQRTPLVISQPTAAQKVNERIKAELIAKIIERQSVGAGGKSAGIQPTIVAIQRSSSSSSATTSASTSTKVVISPYVLEMITFVQSIYDTFIAIFQPPLPSSSGGCSLNKY